MQYLLSQVRHLISNQDFKRKSLSILLMCASAGMIGMGLYYSFDVPGNLRQEFDSDLFENEHPLSDAARMRLQNAGLADLLDENISNAPVSALELQNNPNAQSISAEQQFMNAVNNSSAVHDPYSDLEAQVQELSEEDRARAKAALMAQIEEMEDEDTNRRNGVVPPFVIEDSQNNAFSTSDSRQNSAAHSSGVNFAVDKNVINQIMNQNLDKKPKSKNTTNAQQLSARSMTFSPPTEPAISKKSALESLASKKVNLVPVELQQGDYLHSQGVFVAKQAIDLFAPASGQVKKILARSGDYVRKDQVIIALETPEEEAEMRLAAAELDHIEKQVERLKEQNIKNTKIKLKLDEALLMLNEKKAAFELAEANVQKKEIKAPFGGYLGQWKVQAGAYVKEGIALNNLVNKNDLQVEYTLPEKYIRTVKVGEQVEVNIDGTLLEGVVRYIAPDLDPKTQHFVVRAQVDRGYENLVPGMQVAVTHKAQDRGTAMLIPREAVLSNKGKQFVYRWHNNQPELVQVAVTRPSQVDVDIDDEGQPEKIQVLSGLTGKDRIVVFKNG